MFFCVVAGLGLTIFIEVSRREMPLWCGILRLALNFLGNPFDLSFVGLYSASSEKVFHDSLKPEARQDKVFSACVKNHLA